MNYNDYNNYNGYNDYDEDYRDMKDVWQNRILNIILIGLIVFILICAFKVFMAYRAEDIKLYNDNIVNFTVEMIKGNKSLEDIDTLNANDTVKESLRQYYNNTFYRDDDLICILENVSTILYDESLKKDSQRIYNSLVENNSIEVKGIIIENITLEEFETHELYGLLYQYELSEEILKYLEKIKVFLFEYNDNIVDTEELILKDNNLYITVLDFEKYEEVCYQGNIIDLSEIILDKSFRDERQKNTTIKLLNSFKENKILYCNIKDDVNNNFSVKFNLTGEKITSIAI